MRISLAGTPTSLGARISALWLWSLMYRIARSGQPAASRAATSASRLAAELPVVNRPPAETQEEVERVGELVAKLLAGERE